MKTSLETLSNIIGAVVWADNEYDEQEKKAVAAVAEALEMNATDLAAAVDKAVAEYKDLNEDDANCKLLAAAAEVAEDEQRVVLGVAIEMALADGVITRDEVETVFSIAGTLGIEEAEAALMIVDKVRDEECYEVAY